MAYDYIEKSLNWNFQDWKLVFNTYNNRNKTNNFAKYTYKNTTVLIFEDVAAK